MLPPWHAADVSSCGHLTPPSAEQTTDLHPEIRQRLDAIAGLIAGAYAGKLAIGDVLDGIEAMAYRAQEFLEG